MNIHCFGCSWTYDLYLNQSSWPQELSKLCPQHNIYNYSLPGSDNVWSLFCMQQIKKQYPNDFFIYQSTNESRITIWSDNPLDNDMIKRHENYFTLDKPQIEKNNNLHTITPSTKKYKKQILGYYKLMTDDTCHFVNKQIIKNNIDIADYSFAQIKTYGLGHDCFIQEITEEVYNSLVVDGKMQHLGNKGCLLQAQWVKEKIGDRLNVE